MNEVVAQRKILRQVLIGTVGGHDAQIMLVGMQTTSRVVNSQNMRDFKLLQLILILAVLIITYIKTRKHLVHAIPHDAGTMTSAFLVLSLSLKARVAHKSSFGRHHLQSLELISRRSDSILIGKVAILFVEQHPRRADCVSELNRRVFARIIGDT